MLEAYRQRVAAGSELDPEAVGAVVGELVREDVAPEEKAAFLLALADKGETAGEIAAFARALRDLAVSVPVDIEALGGVLLDVCGTGGDHLGTFNLSTTVAIVCAAADVPVAKHGNRAITSQTGSADVLEALGIPVDLEPAASARQLKELGFTFLFAPRYHPAFRHLAPARKLCAAAGRRTLFNFLGPLLNPARPTAQMVGVSVPGLVENLARTLQQLGVRRGMVVSGEVPGVGYLDELSIFGGNEIAEFHHERGFHRCRWEPSGLPLTGGRLEDLKGGDREANARRVEAILGGRDVGPGRDAVLLNAGAALMVAGRCASIAEGWELAREVVASGRAAARLEALRGRA